MIGLASTLIQCYLNFNSNFMIAMSLLLKVFLILLSFFLVNENNIDFSGQSNQEFFQFGSFNVDQFDVDTIKREQPQNANNSSDKVLDFLNHP